MCAFTTRLDPRTLPHRLRPPEGLFALSAAKVDAGFSPRRAATRRLYRYSVVDGKDVDWSKVRSAGAMLEGIHDFRNFCRPDEGVPTRRRLDRIEVLGRGSSRALRFTAPNFLWEQVRRMVNALLRVGRGDWPASRIQALLDAPGRDEPVPPAEARPLVLERVDVAVEFPRASAAQRSLLERATVGQRLRAAYFDGLVAANSPTDRR